MKISIIFMIKQSKQQQRLQESKKRLPYQSLSYEIQYVTDQVTKQNLQIMNILAFYENRHQKYHRIQSSTNRPTSVAQKKYSSVNNTLKKCLKNSLGKSQEKNSKYEKKLGIRSKKENKHSGWTEKKSAFYINRKAREEKQNLQRNILKNRQRQCRSWLSLHKQEKNKKMNPASKSKYQILQKSKTLNINKTIKYLKL